MKKFVITVIGLAGVAGIGLILWFAPNVVANIQEQIFGGDPDVPDFAQHKVDRKEFMLSRHEQIAMKRGIYKDQRFDPRDRIDAIRQMERQEEDLARNPSLVPQAAWTELGPNPIPNGQTTTTSVAVSGRVISIAVHPTNPNIVYVGTAQGGLYRSLDGGTNWTRLTESALSLAIGAIAIAPSQPETIYIGTGEGNFSADSYFGVGIYRIDNAGTTATLTGPFGPFTGRAVSEIIVHPTIPATIFASSTSGIAGLRPIGPAAPSDANVYRSTNATSAAPTFTNLVNGNFNVRDIAIDATDPNVLLATFPGTGVVRFTNALGASSLTIPLTFGDVAEITSQGGSPATFFVASGVGAGTIHRSVDGGLTWTTQSNTGFCSGQCFYNIAVAVDPTNANNVLVGGQSDTAGVITGRSTNGGTTFTPVNDNLHADSHVITFAPSNPSIVYTGNDGGIFKSIDGGQTYTSLNNSQFSATQFWSIDTHPTNLDFAIGGTQDNGTNMNCLTCGAPHTPPWRRVDFGDGGYAVIDQNAPDNVNVRMYHTYFNNGGLQGYGTVASTATASSGLWAFRGCGSPGATTNGITCNGSVNFYAPVERGPGNPNTIYYGSDRLYRSNDTGLTHTVVSQNPIAAGVPISSIGISPQNDNVRIVGLNNGAIWGTTTGSSTLTDFDPGNAVPNSPINSSVIDPLNVNTAYVTLSAFGVTNVWKTTTLSSFAGEGNIAPTWTAAAGSGGTALPQVPVNSLIVDPQNSDRLYAATDIGVYTSGSGGTHWIPFGTGLPRVAVFDIAITAGTTATRQVKIATHGRGMWQTPALAPTAASVRVSGRILTENGMGIFKARVKLTDAEGNVREALTNQFGFYGFEDIGVGQLYVVTVSARGYEFEPQSLLINGELSNLDFTLTNSSGKSRP